MGKLLNLLDKKFGKLTVLKRVPNNKGQKSKWECLCDCGKLTWVVGSKLVAGETKSCGCLHKESVSGPPGESGFNSLYKTYRSEAKNRDLIFDLSKEQFKQIVISNCFYCGTIPSQISSSNYSSKEGYKHSSFTYNGIDRVNNELGYLLQNCVPCCEQCNEMKSSRTKEEFLQKVKDIYKHVFLKD